MHCDEKIKAMKKKLLLSLFCIACIIQVSAQQDAQFSQYMFNGIYINPAYAGYREVWNVHAFYRNQWSSFPGAPKTISLAVDGIAHEKRYGLAFQAVSDKIGLQENVSMYANFAVRIPIEYEESGKTLSLGIGAGVIQNRIRVDEFDPTSDPVGDDPTLYNAVATRFTPDASVGVFYNSNSFYAGLSADNLITSAYDSKSTSQDPFAERKIHMYITAGALLPVSEVLQFKPSILFKEDFAGPTSLDVNAFMLLNEKLWIGAGYRTSVFNKPLIQDDLKKSGAVIGMVELFLGQKIRIGYAYEYSINYSTLNNYPTNEISLSYFFINPKAAMYSPRYF
jgi:type IX secretion system PorP/SprF family membrane protein